VEALQEQTVTELLQAGDDAEQQKQAIKRYFRCGDAAHLSPGELWDFLGISADSVLERAGFDETDEAFNTFTEMASQASAEVIKEVTDTPKP
jgi:hypothetical protein